MPSLEILCSIIEQQCIPLTKPFTQHPRDIGAHNDFTMKRMAAVPIHTTLVAVNAMDQGQQCAACRTLVNCYFELTLSSIRLTSLCWSCGVWVHPRDVHCVGSTEESHTQMNSANPIARLTKCGGCIPTCGLLFLFAT